MKKYNREEGKKRWREKESKWGGDREERQKWRPAGEEE